MSPVIRSEHLIDYAWNVQRTQAQEADPRDGQPLFHDNGDPKMVELTSIFWLSKDGNHSVRIDFDEPNRAKLVEALTGVRPATLADVRALEPKH